jgi:hypothetical protein
MWALPLRTIHKTPARGALQPIDCLSRDPFEFGANLCGTQTGAFDRGNGSSAIYPLRAGPDYVERPNGHLLLGLKTFGSRFV